MPCGSNKRIGNMCLTSNCYSREFDYNEQGRYGQRIVCWKCGEEFEITPSGIVEAEDRDDERSVARW